MSISPATGTINIGGHDYPIVGTVKDQADRDVPLVDMPMMSDEKWNEYCRNGAVSKLRERGVEPTEKNIQAYYQEIRDMIDKIERGVA